MHRRMVIVPLLICSAVAIAVAGSGYIGYSGAPGSRGTCASSCHGHSGGTIQITGFPAEYVPDQTYAIAISHAGGSSINQFNGSCRIGTGSHNAGVIAAGTNTVTYSVSGETNGVHFTAPNRDTGTFFWTAPSAGAGDVRLYVAGLQGSFSGYNTELALTATEQTAAVGDSEPGGSRSLWLRGNSPQPFQARTVVDYEIASAGPVHVSIHDVSGRLLETRTIDQPAGRHQFAWDAGSHPAGIYYCTIQTASSSATRSMMRVQ